MFDWSTQKVLVTGASSGIGAALARELAKAGATVGICARRSELLDVVLDDCRKFVPNCQAWTMDLGEIEAIDGFVAQVETDLGGIDILINNAGLVIGNDVPDTPWSEVVRLMEVNYLSPVRLTLAALPAMVARGSGRVVSISSMAARMSTPGEAPYSASKAALSAYIEALAAEMWESPVRFMLVYPALIEVLSGLDGDDELAISGDGIATIPAPVTARAIMRGIEDDDFELYIPKTMHGVVAGRANNVVAMVELMAAMHKAGTLHG